MLELSFCPTGFGCVYYIGIIEILQEKLKYNYIKNNVKIACSSSGVLASLILLINCQNSKQLYYDLLDKYGNNMFGKGNDIVRDIFEKIVPKDIDLNLLNDKLYINYCTMDGFRVKSHIVSTYNSRDELLNYVLASSYIPFYSGKQIYINEQKSYDGFFFSQIPFFSKNTIAFCPFLIHNQNCILTHQCNVFFNVFFPITNKKHNEKLIEQGKMCGLFAFNNYIK